MSHLISLVNSGVDNSAVTTEKNPPAGFPKSLNNEQWKEIENQLSYPFGNVELICDGYKVNAVIRQEKALKQVIEIYINGKIEGKWVMGSHEESTKFLCKKTTYLYKQAERAIAKKKLAKCGLDQWFKDYYNSIINTSSTIYLPHWTSPTAFCRHIRKTCVSIEIVKVGY